MDVRQLPTPGSAPVAVPETPPTLTDREAQILLLISHGRENPEIGRALFLSEDTVKTHVRRLFRKIAARNRTHAVRRGCELGLLEIARVTR